MNEFDLSPDELQRLRETAEERAREDERLWREQAPIRESSAAKQKEEEQHSTVPPVPRTPSAQKAADGTQAHPAPQRLNEHPPNSYEISSPSMLIGWCLILLFLVGIALWFIERIGSNSGSEYELWKIRSEERQRKLVELRTEVIALSNANRERHLNLPADERQGLLQVNESSRKQLEQDLGREYELTKRMYLLELEDVQDSFGVDRQTSHRERWIRSQLERLEREKPASLTTSNTKKDSKEGVTPNGLRLRPKQE